MLFWSGGVSLCSAIDGCLNGQQREVQNDPGGGGGEWVCNWCPQRLLLYLKPFPVASFEVKSATC